MTASFANDSSIKNTSRFSWRKKKYLDDASKAKVGNFYNVVVADENISCGEVAMDIVL